MCGNIKRLRFPDRFATDAEIDAAVLQYVRKISNLRKPSASNQQIYDKTCEGIAIAVRDMLNELHAKRKKTLAGTILKPI